MGTLLREEEEKRTRKSGGKTKQYLVHIFKIGYARGGVPPIGEENKKLALPWWSLHCDNVLTRHLGMAILEALGSLAVLEPPNDPPLQNGVGNSIGRQSYTDPQYRFFTETLPGGRVVFNPPALPACLVNWGLMMTCLSVLSFCLYSLS